MTPDDREKKHKKTHFKGSDDEAEELSAGNTEYFITSIFFFPDE